MPSPVKPYCTIDAQASFISPTSLQLHYRVKNTSDYVLFLMNGFWNAVTMDGQYQVQPNKANVQVGPDRVTISKKVVPVPEDMEVEFHYTPCMSRLGPHETYEETLEIAVPVVPFTWYLAPWDEPVPASKGVLRPLYFELGYLALPVQNESAIRLVATSHGPAYHRNTEPEDQLVVCAGPLLSDVAVA